MPKQLSSVTFHNGQKMPIVGLGTWQSAPEEVTAAVDVALELGYRHIDTAYMYQNEAAIGKTLKKWFASGKLKREDIFIVTKLPPIGNRAESVERFLTKSLEALQLDYVDLYLIHIPTGFQEIGDSLWPTDETGAIAVDPSTDLISLWKSMETQVDAGRTRSIGLSNFNSRQIARIVKAARIQPANLQVELNVYFQQRELVAFCRALDITVCAYAPLGSPGLPIIFKARGQALPESAKFDPLTDPVVRQIAEHHKKTPAQVLLRHCMQRDIVVIPKSTNAARIKENFQVFDFELSKEEVEELDSLDKRYAGRRFLMDALGGLKHPEFPFGDPY
ncbi:Alcohol dehydrogenase [NADP(+)] [Cryptotermes secundus]|uniref:Alcohol dehydrogenase [NADP(+)] n=1 Tax=Cryptotermes secundus TaxID=105785 RepID=A0A2J7QZP5_9NEOP|nr:1,5-anhydro-D-fructose reductase [Cryptotermes secundus]PNF34058.1 Alcohol dehydrogenase [NADP(+)] [Cryptotermes secundus]